ncbi:MAG: hypothetical protein BroJett040_18480 [Oligoflexia bacterium]|nr:MAG: hypothetical protein BroJett040_18480 [Oligoflexia bacterium]
MSLSCPKCGAQIDQDFGLVNCPGCATVLSVDVDGQIHVPSETHVTIEYQSEQAAGQFEGLPLQEDQSIVEVPHVEEASAAEPSSDEPLADQMSQVINAENSDSLHDGYTQQEPTEQDSTESTYEQSAIDQSAGEPSINEQAVNVQPAQESSEEPVNTEFQSIFPEENQPEDDQVIEEPQSSAKMIQEIRDYGNSETGANPLSYSIIIEGLDYSEIREKLREVLDDPKMKWDVDEIMARVRGGRLVLDNLNPVKASILVRRIMPLKMKFTWSQHVYS